eukprot:2601533-Prymnesium_polylepis.3
MPSQAETTDGPLSSLNVLAGRDQMHHAPVALIPISKLLCQPTYAVAVKVDRALVKAGGVAPRAARSLEMWHPRRVA